jgi:hypothetical protein
MADTFARRVAPVTSPVNRAAAGVAPTTSRAHMFGIPAMSRTPSKQQPEEEERGVSGAVNELLDSAPTPSLQRCDDPSDEKKKTPKGKDEEDRGAIADCFISGC